MVSRTAFCPPLLYTVIQVLVYYLHLYISEKLVLNYASIAKLKMIIQKIQYHEQKVAYFRLCSVYLHMLPQLNKGVSSEKNALESFSYRRGVYFKYLQTYDVTKRMQQSPY